MVFYTQKELAEMLRVSQMTIVRMRDKGELPYVRMPGRDRVLYPTREINRMLRENYVGKGSLVIPSVKEANHE